MKIASSLRFMSDIVKLKINQALFPIIALHTYDCRTSNIDQACEGMTDLHGKIKIKTKQ